MSIKNFSIEYDAINSKNIFTNGDTINGRIIVEVPKETRIKSLMFLARGEARVGQQSEERILEKEEYYDVRQNMLRETRQDGTAIIGKGRHEFPFSFTIPDKKMPSSLELPFGKIVHKLKAELTLPWKGTRKAETHFTFQSKPDWDTPGLLDSQYGFKDRTVKVCGAGRVTMHVHTERIGYKQGEAVQVTINNHSNSSIKPKFLLYRKLSYYAQGRKIQSFSCTDDILKEKPLVAARSKRLVTVFTIPMLLPASITGCSIIKLEYRLKVYLDYRYDSGPENEIPIIVFPASALLVRKAPPPSAPYLSEVFRHQSRTPRQPAPQQQPAPQPADLPPSYEQHAMYPTVSEPRRQTKL